MTTTTREQLFQAIEPAVFHHTDQEELERALTRLEAIIDAACTEARIDEWKQVTKNIIEKPVTPENQADATWQGGYRFAKNSLKRYKLARVAELQSGKEAGTIGSDTRTKIGLIERRHEVYQLWEWACGAFSKGIVIREHRGYIEQLYRRYNDLTDQLQALIGDITYEHYAMDEQTLLPISMAERTTE